MKATVANSLATTMAKKSMMMDVVVVDFLNAIYDEIKQCALEGKMSYDVNMKEDNEFNRKIRIQLIEDGYEVYTQYKLPGNKIPTFNIFWNNPTKYK